MTGTLKASLSILRRARRGLRLGFAGALGLALIATHGVETSAQQAPSAAYAVGDAAVTGFSGASPPVRIAPGVDPRQETFIDLTGPSLRVVDLRHMGGPPDAQLVGALKPLTVSAARIGQVFGVALDDMDPPNIYAAASSAYGLPIVAPGPDGRPRHVQIGRPNAAFMPGLWGPQGGPGSIWKIDGKTGRVSLFANVALEGRANSGAALGGLAYDPDSKSLFAADRETGFIHRFGLNGEALGRYDHGVTGRAAQGLAPAPWNAQPGIDVASPQFDSGQPSTWNYAALARRVFGLAVYQRRLYYAAAEGLLVWSVGLNPDGSFANDAAIELAAPRAAGPTEISKIAFDEQGRMFLAERPAPTGAFDFEALAVPALGRVLRFEVVGAAAGGRRVWRQSPDEYAIGFPAKFRNDNGGVAIGYNYAANGEIARGSCGGFLWATGEDLRDSSDARLALRLARSGPLHVNGLQGEGAWRIRRDGEAPLQSYFIEYEDGLRDAAARGRMGDIAIARRCANPQPAALGPPTGGGAPPTGGQAGGGQAGGGPGGGVPPGPTPPASSCPPGHVCPPPTSACPPGQTCPPRPTPVCPPGRVCPPGSGVPVETQAQCQAGQTAITPSNFCCNTGEVYTSTSGGQACCSGQVVNGQCQPPPPPPPSNPNCSPGSTNPQCCAKGYVSTGSSCCLAGQMTSSGVCCASGQAPSGPIKSACAPINRTPVGPRCCASGLIPAGNGSCCAAANITTSGACCPVPVDPNNRAHCPTETQFVPLCAPGYTKTPDGACCENRFLSADGRSCNAGGRVCAPGETRDRNGVCTPVPGEICLPGEIRTREGVCVPVLPLPPGVCPPGQLRNRDGVCVALPTQGCPIGQVRTAAGVCAPLPPGVCPPGQLRNRDGVCVALPAQGCSPGEVRTAAGVCAPLPANACPPGEVRDAQGVCAPVRPRLCQPGEAPGANGGCVTAGPPPHEARPARPLYPFGPPPRRVRVRPFRGFAPPRAPVLPEPGLRRHDYFR